MVKMTIMAQRNKHLLLYLAEASEKQFRSFIKISDRQQILALREVVANLLKGNIPIDDKDRKALRRQRIFLRQLVEKGANPKDLSSKTKVLKKILSLAKPIIEKI